MEHAGDTSASLSPLRAERLDELGARLLERVDVVIGHREGVLGEHLEGGDHQPLPAAKGEGPSFVDVADDVLSGPIPAIRGRLWGAVDARRGEAAAVVDLRQDLTRSAEEAARSPCEPRLGGEGLGGPRVYSSGVRSISSFNGDQARLSLVARPASARACW